MDQRERNIWWGPPRQFSAKLHERKISWLELFYDLVYVAAIAQLSQYLADHPTWQGLGYFFFLFALIFWSWLNGSYYHDTHGNAGIRTRYFTLLQMFVVAAVAATLPALFEGNHRQFIIAFSCVQALITYLWWSTGYYDRNHARFTRYYVFSYGLAFVLFIISIFTEMATAHYLWGVGLILNYGASILGGPELVRELKKHGTQYQTSKTMIERFGLFTIIVLGENILGVVHGISHAHFKSVELWIIFLLAILIAFLLWWIYFDLIGDSESKEGYRYFLLLNIVYNPLLGAFAAAGSAIRVILAETGHGSTNLAERIFSLAVTLILVGIFCITKLMKQEPQEQKVLRKLNRMLGITTLLVLILTLFTDSIGVVAWLAAIAFVIIVPVYIGTRLWVKYKIFSGNPEE